MHNVSTAKEYSRVTQGVQWVRVAHIVHASLKPSGTSPLFQVRIDNMTVEQINQRRNASRVPRKAASSFDLRYKRQDKSTPVSVMAGASGTEADSPKDTT